MLLDIINTYDTATINNLRSVRQNIVLNLAKEHDAKKIMTFLNKCAVIGIDEQQQAVTIGLPNEFIAQQVKRFFKKPLIKSVQDVYNPQFDTHFVMYPTLQQGDHQLQLSLKTLLDVPDRKPKTEVISTSTKATMETYFGILFESKYSFDNFVVGATNQLAHSAAEAIAQKPGEIYNPFFIYGEVGLGKTHLMQAIGNQIMESFPEKTVLYLPTTKFIDYVVKAIRYNKLSNLLDKLEQVDVLMLDDVQFLAGKEKTQEIFHNIFNDFHSKNKQIVITCDQAPKSLTLLEARLQSRFSLGLIADIKAPDLETRIAILQSKLTKKDAQLDSEHIELIASTVDANVRELEGALNIIITKKQLLKQEISHADVVESLQTLGYKIGGSVAPKTATHQTQTTPQTTIGTSQQASFDYITEQIATYYNIPLKALLGAGRTKEVSFARQMAMYIAKKHFQWSLSKIGSYFGGKNHASVIYAIKKFEENMKEDPHLGTLINQLMGSNVQ